MRHLASLLMLLLLAACGRGPTALGLTGGDDLVVRSGTSFGMCVGYCIETLEIREGEMVMTRTSRQLVTHPPLVERRPLAAGEWEELVALAKPGAFDGLQEVYGCPDCADGGAERVEVESGGRVRTVTFEYGAEVPRIQPLVERLREMRARFPKP